MCPQSAAVWLGLAIVSVLHRTFILQQATLDLSLCGLMIQRAVKEKISYYNNFSGVCSFTRLIVSLAKRNHMAKPRVSIEGISKVREQREVQILWDPLLQESNPNDK